MATVINNITIPDYDLGGGEICHGFTINYLWQTRIHINHLPIFLGYLPITRAEHLLSLLQAFGYNHQNLGTPIQRNDILIFSTENTVPAQQPPICHSMVAIAPTNWFGANNGGTFNSMLHNPVNPGRCNINVTQLANNPYNAGTGILTIPNPNNPEAHIDLYVHIYR